MLRPNPYTVTLCAALALSMACATDEPVPPGGNGGANNANNSTNNATNNANNTSGGTNNTTNNPTNNNPTNNDPAGVEIDAISPTTGALAGGTEVTINGSGFTSEVTVTFGGVAAASVDARSPSQLLAVTPAGANPGAVDVTVAVGADSATLTGAFSYDAPPATERYCKLQAQSPANAITGAPTDALYAVIFATGVTEGAGAGADITAEVGYGSGDDPAAFDYMTAAFNVDVDGLAPGDMANDEWGAPLTVATAGSYKYAIRFQVDGDDGWTYCDLDGSDNGIAADQLGVLEVADAPSPEVAYCITQTGNVQAAPGDDTAPIVGAVFVAGDTEAAGQGALVTAEVVWGDPGADPSTWTAVTATYLDDEGNNDRYSAALNSANAGDFAYAMRFSVDGGTTWALCDTDGTDYGNGDAFEPAKAGTFQAATAPTNLPDACFSQFPTVRSTTTGTSERYFMRVTEAGVTDAGDDGADVRVEAYWGPNGDDPVSNPGAFTSIAATFNTTDGPTGNAPDEYEVSWAPATAGSYAVYWRASVDAGQNWTWCDIDGTDLNNPFDATAVTVVDVFDVAPEAVDYCHVFDAARTKSLADPSEPIYVAEVYDATVTEGTMNGANANQLEVEFGHGPLGSNPAYGNAYTWPPPPSPARSATTTSSTAPRTPPGRPPRSPRARTPRPTAWPYARASRVPPPPGPTATQTTPTARSPSTWATSPRSRSSPETSSDTSRLARPGMLREDEPTVTHDGAPWVR